MPTVTAMFDDLDPELTRAFAQAREPLPDDAFMANLLLKIERARRARLWRRSLAIAAVGVIALLNLRPLLEQTAAVVRFVGDHTPAAPAAWLVTPWGWGVSTLVGVWVVLRTRPSRR
jgi:hypothetical protein